MVFVSKNIVRKCKYCEKEPKKNLTSGRNKGYYITCGSQECLNAQYRDHHVCALKGRSKKIVNFICVLCGEPFIRETANHKRYCKKCAPNEAWRGRARRYLIGKPQWESLLERQNNKCALCDRNPEVVDHCHKQGIVRGLLCNACNIKIKIIESCPDFLQKAMNYVGVKYAVQK
jgi:hypothetical protein